MPSLIARLKKDLSEVAGVAGYDARIAALEQEVEKLEKQLQSLNRELGSVSRKTAAISARGGQKKKPLIDIVEEIMAGKGGGPMKVTEIKDILINEKKITTRAKNFYAVITVSLNNSDRFKKTAPGEYKLLKGKKK